MKLLHITALALCLNTSLSHGNNAQDVALLGFYSGSFLIAAGLYDGITGLYYATSLKKIAPTNAINCKRIHEFEDLKDQAFVDTTMKITAGGLLCISSLMYTAMPREMSEK